MDGRVFGVLLECEFSLNLYLKYHRRYSEAIATKPDRDGLCFLYGNRCLAYCRAHRYQDALRDADNAIAVAPRWGKGHWRRGMAHLGLKLYAPAVMDFLEAWRLQGHDAECHKKLWQTVQRLTREELASGLLRELASLQLDSSASSTDELQVLQVEQADEKTLIEATFRLIVDAHKTSKSPGSYYQTYLRWLTHGIDPAEALTVRAAIHLRAKCYLQAREDAQAAIKLLQVKFAKLDVDDGDKDSEHVVTNAVDKNPFKAKPVILTFLGEAYLHLGLAFLAEPTHPDRDPFNAYIALSHSVEIGTTGQDGRDRLQEATELLTKEALERAMREVKSTASPWMPSGDRNADRIFQVEIELKMLGAEPADVMPKHRKKLIHFLAALANVPLLAVALESVRLRSSQTESNYDEVPEVNTRTLEIILHVDVGGDIVQGNALVKALHDATVLEQMRQQTGLSSEKAIECVAELIDITQRRSVIGGSGESSERLDPTACSSIVPASPKMELELPYKMYKLVTATGKSVERADKHPFCMSRVYYDATEKPEEVWVEIADGSCRWRQSGGEVRIIALRVPAEVAPRNVQVDFAPFNIKVWNTHNGDVYLEGRLHRGIVPEDCYWTHCGGDGEDGCCITLTKMNLEVLARHWAHSESWWSRLFENHGEIAWDDYEKDYSDLPAEVLDRYRIGEATKNSERQIEDKERRRRERLQEADDLRKRTRQERLHFLRSGQRSDWVRLHNGEADCARIESSVVSSA